MHVTISGRSPGGDPRRQWERNETRKVSFQAQTCGGELQSAPAGASGRHTAPALGARELESHTGTQHLPDGGFQGECEQTPGHLWSLGMLTKWLSSPKDRWKQKIPEPAAEHTDTIRGL